MRNGLAVANWIFMRFQKHRGEQESKADETNTEDGAAQLAAGELKGSGMSFG